MWTWRTWAGFAVVALVAACERGPAGGERAMPVARATVAPRATAGGPVTTASGLEYVDLRLGREPALKRGKVAVIHYTCALPDGVKVDSSRDRGRALQFRVGEGQVIKAWDEGVVGMGMGGIRRLVVPPALGYGAEGFEDVVPPNATLTCEVQLLAIR